MVMRSRSANRRNFTRSHRVINVDLAKWAASKEEEERKGEIMRSRIIVFFVINLANKVDVRRKGYSTERTSLSFLIFQRVTTGKVFFGVMGYVKQCGEVRRKS
jgi:hypothetical protein